MCNLKKGKQIELCSNAKTDDFRANCKTKIKIILADQITFCLCNKKVSFYCSGCLLDILTISQEEGWHLNLSLLNFSFQWTKCKWEVVLSQHQEMEQGNDVERKSDSKTRNEQLIPIKFSCAISLSEYQQYREHLFDDILFVKFI